MFQQVKQQLNIKQVVEFYGVRLNRANKGECPFHKEKTKGAFSVHDSKQIYNCFSCNEGGDLIAFVSRLFALSMIDACKKLNEDFLLGLSNKKLGKKERKKIKMQVLKKKEAQKKIDSLERQYWTMLEIWTILDNRIIELQPKRFDPVPDELIKIWEVMPILELKLEQDRERWHYAKRRINVS